VPSRWIHTLAWEAGAVRTLGRILRYLKCHGAENDPYYLYP
jgi:hypothetical protein